MIIDVERNYTYLNTKQMMNLKSKHSIRMLGLLNKIDSNDIKARDKRTLDQIKRNLELISNEEYENYFKKEDLVRKTEELKRKPLPK